MLKFRIDGFDLAVFTLFLGFLLARMHLHFREIIRLRSRARASRQETERLEREKLQLKEKEGKANEEKTRLQKEISNITENLKKLKMESEEKEKRVETAEAHVIALQKQSADLLLEYDRLLEENQNLQSEALGT